MNEVNFEVNQNALAVVQNAVIEANFDEVKAALAEMVRPYTNMVVTEDGIAAAKADRAKIRKVAARVDDVRKTVKKTYSAPLAEFEAKCKELVAVCDEGSDNLDRQIKEFEQAEADAKIARLREVYEKTDEGTTAGLYEHEYCPWEAVFNPKWANKGYSEEQAMSEIAAAMLKTREDIETIRTMGEQDVPALMAEYKRTRDMGAVVRLASQLQTAREEIRKREEEKRRKTVEEKAKADIEARTVRTAEPHKPENDRLQETTEKIDLVTVDFRVTCTKNALDLLGEYMRRNGIKYGRVPNGN